MNRQNGQSRQPRQKSSWDNYNASLNYDKEATERYAQRRRAGANKRYTYVNPFDGVPLDWDSQASQQNYPSSENAQVDQRSQDSQPSQSGKISQRSRDNQENTQDKEHNQDNKHRNSIIFRVTILMMILALILGVFACAINCSGDGGTTNNAGCSAAFSNPSEDIVMTLHGDRNTQVLKGEEYLEAGAYAIDTKAGTNVTDSIKTSGSVNTNKVGNYFITYTVTDAEGKTHSQTRNVKVVDSMDADTDGISVMMYHYVYDDANPPASLNNNYISASKFESQLKWLKESSYYYPSYQELRAYVQGKHSLPKKSVILTFDDGEEGFLSIGGNLLKKYEIPATSFIIGNLPQTPANLIKFANPYIDYQSHTYGLHVDGTSGKGKGGKIYDLNMEQQVEDFNKSKEIIGSLDALAYPFGDYSEQSAEACEKAGILCAFTVDYNQVKRGDNPETLSRIRVIGTSSLDSFVYQVENGVG